MSGWIKDGVELAERHAPLVDDLRARALAAKRARARVLFDEIDGQKEFLTSLGMTVALVPGQSSVVIMKGAETIVGIEALDNGAWSVGSVHDVSVSVTERLNVDVEKVREIVPKIIHELRGV